MLREAAESETLIKYCCLVVLRINHNDEYRERPSRTKYPSQGVGNQHTADPPASHANVACKTAYQRRRDAVVPGELAGDLFGQIVDIHSE